MTQTPTSKKPEGSAPLICDYRGLKCPLPVLKARRALALLDSGMAVSVLADDPAAPLDIAHFCSTEGHQLVQSETDEAFFTFLIIKGAATGS